MPEGLKLMLPGHIYLLLQSITLGGAKVLISETELIARYCETDRMGIVHHSNYSIWFEAGRTDFLRDLGSDIKN